MSSRRAITAPPITSPWPEAYFVRLCTYTSMSNWPWLWKPANVLSSTVSVPCARQAAVMRSMSATFSTGLVGDSNMTRRVGRDASVCSIAAVSSIDSIVCATP